MLRKAVFSFRLFFFEVYHIIAEYVATCSCIWANILMISFKESFIPVWSLQHFTHSQSFLEGLLLPPFTHGVSYEANLRLFVIRHLDIPVVIGCHKGLAPAFVTTSCGTSVKLQKMQFVLFIFTGLRKEQL